MDLPFDNASYHNNAISTSFDSKVFSVIFGFCIAKSRDKTVANLPDKGSIIVKHLIIFKTVCIHIRLSFLLVKGD
jgi:hypothetical protein